MKQLIEDYKKRLRTANEAILDFKTGNTGSENDIKKFVRLTTKASEYRTFIAELERALCASENVQNDNKSNPIDETPQLISRIDFSTLRTQKKTLIDIIDQYELNKNVMVSKLLKESEASDLNGILNLIDSIQDFACDVMGMNPIDVFDFEVEESREDVVKSEDSYKLIDSRKLTDPVIKNIITRKKQGIDCTEEESAEIKGYLRELKMPDEQHLVGDIQSLFPQEYGEYLDET